MASRHQSRDGTMQFQSWLDALRNRVRTNRSRRPAGQRRGTPNSPPPATSESLENRALLSVSSLLINGELSIISDDADSITVRPNPTSTTDLQVIENGVEATTLSGVQVTDVTSINIRGGSGSNNIDLSLVDPALFTNLVSVNIEGRDGNDTIVGTSGFDDVIDGGASDIAIVGGTVPDVEAHDSNGWLLGWLAGLRLCLLRSRQ